MTSSSSGASGSLLRRDLQQERGGFGFGAYCLPLRKISTFSYLSRFTFTLSPLGAELVISSFSSGTGNSR
ncbi:MAG: hypothetical protein BWY99_01776 [Synergistetes bacterium ADurb.BinA166]|nr:MAG: hypothetical protein BWY99_01776 [Synergistetes bacterium ADurb.BinA166]